LWNTIDERFMEKRFLPNDWHDPENPLYKVARPVSGSTRRTIGKSWVGALRQAVAESPAHGAALISVANKSFEQRVLHVVRRPQDSVYTLLGQVETVGLPE
jgi:hypothetical protein